MTDPALRQSNAPACWSAGRGSIERGDGAGLGLAIVQDVLNAYGWRLELAASNLGGLKATIAPAAG